MNTVQHYLSTIKTSVSPIPIVLTKPELLKLWIFNINRKRLALLALCVLILLVAVPISQFFVDALYPIDKDALSTRLKDIFNNPAYRDLQSLRESRYVLILSSFSIVAGLSFITILVSELPIALKKGEDKAAELLDQYRAAKDSDPQLANTLVSKANALLLSLPPDIKEVMPLENKDIPPATDTKKTVAMPAQKKPERYIGANQRYLVVKALASGGSGVVYLAKDTLLERQVAIKELLEGTSLDDSQQQRFQDEARALAKLSHPVILPVYDLIDENGHFWLVMELLTGGTLINRIEKAGRMDIPGSIKIIRGVASGLGFAHEKGFVHRDIKPENILFAADGSYRITDFGIAKSSTSSTKTAHGLVLGSPAYMSPEQSLGEPVDNRSDIYSLGITFYQMLTGTLPFEGETGEVLVQQVSKQPVKVSQLNAEVSPALEKLIMKMLEKKPERRFKNTDDLISALDRLKL